MVSFDLDLAQLRNHPPGKQQTSFQVIRSHSVTHTMFAASRHHFPAICHSIGKNGMLRLKKILCSRSLSAIVTSFTISNLCMRVCLSCRHKLNANGVFPAVFRFNCIANHLIRCNIATTILCFGFTPFTFGTIVVPMDVWGVRFFSSAPVVVADLQPS